MYTVRAVAQTTCKADILLAATFSISTAWVVYRTQGEHFQANISFAVSLPHLHANQMVCGGRLLIALRGYSIGGGMSSFSLPILAVYLLVTFCVTSPLKKIVRSHKTSTTSGLDLCPYFIEIVVGQASFPFHISQNLSQF